MKYLAFGGAWETYVGLLCGGEEGGSSAEFCETRGGEKWTVYFQQRVELIRWFWYLFYLSGVFWSGSKVQSCTIDSIS